MGPIVLYPNYFSFTAPLLLFFIFEEFVSRGNSSVLVSNGQGIPIMTLTSNG